MLAANKHCRKFGPYIQQLFALVFFQMFILSSAGAGETSVHVTENIAPGNCGYKIAGTRTIKVCRDAQGKYQLVSPDAAAPTAVDIEQPEGQRDTRAKGLTSIQKRFNDNYVECLYHALAHEGTYILAFQDCVNEGIILCNSEGIPTSKDFTVSPVTGRVGFSNAQCGIRLESTYNGAVAVFENEYENYSQSEAAGVAYQPIMFDLRKYVGQ